MCRLTPKSTRMRELALEPSRCTWPLRGVVPQRCRRRDTTSVRKSSPTWLANKCVVMSVFSWVSRDSHYMIICHIRCCPASRVSVYAISKATCNWPKRASRAFCHFVLPMHHTPLAPRHHQHTHSRTLLESARSYIDHARYYRRTYEAG